MTATNCRSVRPHDSLSRDHMLHLPEVEESSPARKIAFGILLGALLALAGIFSGPPQSIDRFALPEELNAPQAAERPHLTLPAEAPPPVVVERR